MATLPWLVEAAALRLCPAIGRLQQRLRALGALAVGMSGSGATLFGEAVGYSSKHKKTVATASQRIGCAGGEG